MRARRFAGILALTLCALALPATGRALADHRPVIVIPGRADVPVYIDGVDAGGAVVTGEWGLHRPGHGSRVIYPDAYEFAPARAYGYFPSSDQRPRYGRHEVDQHKGRRLGSASYYRAWSAQSEQQPATIRAEREPPSVIMAPKFDRGLNE